MPHINLKTFSRIQRLNNQKGFTLVELLVIVAILGVLVGIASLSLNGWHRSRLVSATAELLADLQTTRMNALTESSVPTSTTTPLGFGLFFTKDGSDIFSYRIFEFIDDGDFSYAAGEEGGGYTKKLGSGLSITTGAAGDPTGEAEAILYDKRGMCRQPDWSSLANRTYVLRHLKVDQARCVVISAVRIREGLWDGASCVAR